MLFDGFHLLGAALLGVTVTDSAHVAAGELRRRRAAKADKIKKGGGNGQ